MALRFPLDRGKIKIKCRCGYTETIDPDSRELYNKGKFDLSPENQNNRFSLKKLSESINLGKIINGTLSIKYRLQNYRYMVDSERKAVRRNIFILSGCLALFAMATMHFLRQ